jgi:hypothetical protein
MRPRLQLEPERRPKSNSDHGASMPLAQRRLALRPHRIREYSDTLHWRWMRIPRFGPRCATLSLEELRCNRTDIASYCCMLHLNAVGLDIHLSSGTCVDKALAASRIYPCTISIGAYDDPIPRTRRSLARLPQNISAIRSHISPV